MGITAIETQNLLCCVVHPSTVRGRCPVHLGAGDLLLGLLGPSVLSFAVQMYRRVGYGCETQTCASRKCLVASGSSNDVLGMLKLLATRTEA